MEQPDHDGKTDPGGFCGTLQCDGMPMYKLVWEHVQPIIACRECAEQAEQLARREGVKLRIVGVNDQVRPW